MLYLHRQNALTHGVMVTQQILVLSFKVRILVGQLRGGEMEGDGEVEVEREG